MKLHAQVLTQALGMRKVLLKELVALARDLLHKISAFSLFNVINKVCVYQELGTLQRAWNVSGLGAALTCCQYQNYLFWDASESVSSGKKMYSC